MNFQSLNPELEAKVLFLANLQRNLNQNQNLLNERVSEINRMSKEQQQQTHPLLIPSLNVSSQKISAMLAALTQISKVNSPKQSTMYPVPIQQSTLTSLANQNINNNHMKTINSKLVNTTTSTRSNGSGFGWGSRQRNMEENWRLHNRNI